MRKIYIIGAMACLFAACKPSVNITTKPTAGSAVFSNYLAIGNSLTAGYSDGSLTVTGQLNSYPQRLFEQFTLVGATGQFIQPLVTGDFGYPAPKKVLAFTHSPCNYKDSSLGPVDNFANPDTLGSYHFSSTVNNGQINNIGVPGIRVVDYPVTSYAIYAATPNILNFPYAQRFYHDPTATPMDELSYRVHNLNPTFFTMWLGSNDVLGYALAGGQGNGTGAAAPLTLNFFNPTDISPIGAFQTAYDSALTIALSTGASGALINIPDISSLPFFNTVPANGLMLARQGQADTLRNYVWGKATWNKVFQPGANYFIIVDHNGQTRQAVPGELILSSVPVDSIKCWGMGSIIPIPAKYVLTTDELQNIRNATQKFNSFIQSEATLHHLAYVDMFSYMKTVASGVSYNGISYSTQYVTGGAFSLDGIHPTPRGYALVANEILRSINFQYHSTIPMVDVNRYHGVNFPN